ncbi:MAG: flagellar basal body P-ring formation chaperone FlgA [Limnohabitans sp.]
MNSGMFNPSVKTSTPAQGLMQILCLTVFCLFWLALPSSSQAQTANSPADSMALQVRQWLSSTHGVAAKQVVIAPLDDRLKVQTCQKTLLVDHPFASKETVRVRCPDPIWQLYLQVTLPSAAPSNQANTAKSATPSGKTVVVAKRLLQRGAILQADMLEEVQASPGNADTQLLSSLKDAQQAELTRDIAAGQALRISDIRRAVMVKQGQSVMLTVGDKTEFQISVRMEAMQDGRMGEQVKLKNPDSGKQVSGIVTGPNTAKGL